MEEKKLKKTEKVPRLSHDSLSKLNSENDTKAKELNYSSRSFISNNSIFGGSVCSDQQFSSILRIYSARVTQQVELTSPSKSKHNTTANTFRNLFKRTKKVNNEANKLNIATDVNQNDTTYHSSTPTTHVSCLSPNKYLSPDRAYNNSYNSFDKHANTSRTCSTKAVSVAESPHRTDLRLVIPTDDNTPTTVHTATYTPLPVTSARRNQLSNHSITAQTDKATYSSLYSIIYKSMRNKRNSTVFIPCIAVIILTLFGKNLIALCLLSLLALKLVYYHIYTGAGPRPRRDE